MKRPSIRDIERAIHNFRCRKILSTEPLSISADGPIILSMVCHADVIMYLFAAKSFYKRLGSGRFVIVDDGTLSPRDRGVISHHLGNPEFIDIASIDTGPCQRGGTWERLLQIIDLTANNYVIQLDCDTLTVGDVLDVRALVESNCSFTLGTKSGLAFVSLEVAGKSAAQSAGNHLQDVAERSLGKFVRATERLYVRGSSGFAGFGRGRHSRAEAEAFSAEMTSFIGERWLEWGSEQVTSNYLVANSPGARVLSFPKYRCFRYADGTVGASFLHFINTERFRGGVYARESLAVLQTWAGSQQ